MDYAALVVRDVQFTATFRKLWRRGDSAAATTLLPHHERMRMSILSSYKHRLEGATVPMARGSVEVVGQAELRDTPGWRTIRVVACEGRRVIPEECSIGRAGVENKQRGERVAGPRRCRELGVCIRIHE